MDKVIKYGAGAGVFSTIYASTAKLAKTSSLPLGGKVAAVLGTSLVGLIGYKVVQENLSTTRPKGQITIQADNVKSNISVSSAATEKLINSTKDKSFPAKSMLDPIDNIGERFLDNIFPGCWSFNLNLLFKFSNYIYSFYSYSVFNNENYKWIWH